MAELQLEQDVYKRQESKRERTSHATFYWTVA